MNVKYQNLFGDSLTSQQIVELSDYSKISFKNNNVKIIEYYSLTISGMSTVVSYFMDTEEAKQDILDKYCDPIKHVKCTLLFNKQQIGRYHLWKWEDYSVDKICTHKGEKVYDEKHRTLFSNEIDIRSDTLKSAQKYYHGNVYSGEFADTLLGFNYNSDGSVKYIFDTHEKYGYIRGITLDEFLEDTEFSQELFPWEQHPYFHSAYPFLPEGDL